MHDPLAANCITNGMLFSFSFAEHQQHAIYADAEVFKLGYAEKEGLEAAAEPERQSAQRSGKWLVVI